MIEEIKATIISVEQQHKEIEEIKATIIRVEQQHKEIEQGIEEIEQGIEEMRLKREVGWTHLAKLNADIEVFTEETKELKEDCVRLNEVMVEDLNTADLLIEELNVYQRQTHRNKCLELMVEYLK